MCLETKKRSAITKDLQIYLFMCVAFLSPSISFNNFALTFTGVASMRIFPHETASSGRAPLSEPSNSLAVFKKRLKSAPFRWKKNKFLLQKMIQEISLKLWKHTTTFEHIFTAIVCIFTVLMFVWDNQCKLFKNTKTNK